MEQRDAPLLRLSARALEPEEIVQSLDRAMLRESVSEYNMLPCGSFYKYVFLATQGKVCRTENSNDKNDSVYEEIKKTDRKRHSEIENCKTLAAVDNDGEKEQETDKLAMKAPLREKEAFTSRGREYPAISTSIITASDGA
ncbi:hypothetical protein NQZ68_023699 [Dissostichus eleginoides]|nr:hypothetical protein NQZ68_023699 [Dissostichus eleginoides]